MHPGLVLNYPNIELAHGWSSFRQYWHACVHHLKHRGQIHRRPVLTSYEQCLTFEAGYQKLRRQNLYGRCLVIDHWGQAFSCIIKVCLMNSNWKWYARRESECQGLGNSQSSDMDVVCDWCDSSEWWLILIAVGHTFQIINDLPFIIFVHFIRVDSSIENFTGNPCVTFSLIRNGFKEGAASWTRTAKDKTHLSRFQNSRWSGRRN